MAYVSPLRNPTVPQHVLHELRVAPGPVDNVFMVVRSQYTRMDGIFMIMHTICTVLKKPVKYVINHTSEAQVFIRCTDPSEANAVEASMVKFSFNSFKIRFYKLSTISRLPEREDRASLELYTAFGAHEEHMNPQFTNYPRGYSDAFDDTDHKDRKSVV